MSNESHDEVVNQLKKINNLDEYLVDLASNPRHFVRGGEQFSKEPESFYNGVTSTLLTLRKVINN